MFNGSKPFSLQRWHRVEITIKIVLIQVLHQIDHFDFDLLNGGQVFGPRKPALMNELL